MTFFKYLAWNIKAVFSLILDIHNKSSDKGKRFNICAAGSMDGWVLNSMKVWLSEKTVRPDRYIFYCAIVECAQK